jgi:hypothetical protein
MQALLSYDWSGNVRELENCIQHMVAISSDTLVHTEDLPSPLQNHLAQRKFQYLTAAVGGPAPLASAGSTPAAACKRSELRGGHPVSGIGAACHSAGSGIHARRSGDGSIAARDWPNEALSETRRIQCRRVKAYFFVAAV